MRSYAYGYGWAVIDRCNIVGRIGCRIRVLAPLAVLLLVAAWPTTANAHTGLRGSAPATDARISQAPTTVVLEYSGEVVVGAHGIQVFGPDGSRVDTGEASPRKGARLTQAIRDGGDGTYGVAYRVSSEDGHVVTGVVQFSVGPAAGNGNPAAATDAASGAAKTDATVEALFSTARGFEILALLIAAGSGIFACIIVPGWRPRWLIGSLLIVLLAYAASFVLNAALASGSDIGGALDVDQLRESWGTPFAFSLAIRAVMTLVALAPALLLAYGSRILTRGAYLVLAVVFAATAASLSLTGHAVTSDPMWLRLPADAIHIIAAAVWLGGLVQLAYLAPQASTHAAAVMRFSKVAMTCVIVIVLSGIAATLVELDLELNQLVDSRYGRLIAAKLILVAAAMPLAWNNQRAFLPVLTTRPDDAPRMLRQYVLREAVLLVVVVCLTVWLIATPQP